MNISFILPEDVIRSLARLLTTDLGLDPTKPEGSEAVSAVEGFLRTVAERSAPLHQAAILVVLSEDILMDEIKGIPSESGPEREPWLDKLAKELPWLDRKGSDRVGQWLILAKQQLPRLIPEDLTDVCNKFRAIVLAARCLLEPTGPDRPLLRQERAKVRHDLAGALVLTYQAFQSRLAWEQGMPAKPAWRTGKPVDIDDFLQSMDASLEQHPWKPHFDLDWYQDKTGAHRFAEALKRIFGDHNRTMSHRTAIYFIVFHITCVRRVGLNLEEQADSDDMPVPLEKTNGALRTSLSRFIKDHFPWVGRDLNRQEAGKKSVDARKAAVD